jgi:uncharacterized membrane protein
LKKNDPAADRVLALTLKIGAYSSFIMILAGLIVQQFAPAGQRLTIAGLLVLLATPALRIVVACVQFLRERDYRYAGISFGVLCIVVLAYLLGLKV